MQDRYLEKILESEDHIEQIPEDESLQKETYDLELKDRYLLDQQPPGLQDGVEKFHEMIPDITDDYLFDDKLEIQSAIDREKEDPPEDHIELRIRMKFE